MSIQRSSRSNFLLDILTQLNISPQYIFLEISDDYMQLISSTIDEQETSKKPDAQSMIGLIHDIQPFILNRILKNTGLTGLPVEIGIGIEMELGQQLRVFQSGCQFHMLPESKAFCQAKTYLLQSSTPPEDVQAFKAVLKSSMTPKPMRPASLSSLIPETANTSTQESQKSIDFSSSILNQYAISQETQESGDIMNSLRFDRAKAEGVVQFFIQLSPDTLRYRLNF